MCEGKNDFPISFCLILLIFRRYNLSLVCVNAFVAQNMEEGSINNPTEDSAHTWAKNKEEKWKIMKTRLYDTHGAEFMLYENHKTTLHEGGGGLYGSCLP
jgi:hypothetical protein